MGRLRKLHPLVAATLKAAETAPTDDAGRLRVAPVEGLIPISVSRRQLRRAMVLLHTLFRLAETRGHEVAAAENAWSQLRGVAINVGGHPYPVRISELTSSMALTEVERTRARKDHPWRKDEEAPTRKPVANGKLKLSFPSFERGIRSRWSEGPRGTLESKLPRILDELEARAVRDDLRDLERARQERERQRELERRQERERVERIEGSRRKRLAAEVEGWLRANEIRDYVAALRKRAIERPQEERERIEAWCEWAERFAEGSDPVVNIETVTGLEDPGDGRRE